MEPYTIYGMPAAPVFDADPFRNGIDRRCALHTCADKIKRAMKFARKRGADAQSPLGIIEESYKGMLDAGCRMAELLAGIRMMELVA